MLPAADVRRCLILAGFAEDTGQYRCGSLRSPPNKPRRLLLLSLSPSLLSGLTCADQFGGNTDSFTFGQREKFAKSEVGRTSGEDRGTYRGVSRVWSLWCWPGVSASMCRLFRGLLLLRTHSCASKTAPRDCALRHRHGFDVDVITPIRPDLQVTVVTYPGRWQRITKIRLPLWCY